MKQWYSARELVGLPGMPSARENIARKARVENWKSRRRNGRGGGSEYAIESLPQQTQAALFAFNLDRIDRIPSLEATSSVQEVIRSEHELDELPTLPAQAISTVARAEVSAEAIANQSLRNSKHCIRAKTTGRKIEQRTDSWLKILQAYENWCESRSFDSAAACDFEFVKAYNNKQLCLPDWIYLCVHHISYSTLKRKNKLRRISEKIEALGGNYGNRKGKGRIDSDSNLQQAIETCIASGGKHWGASQIYEILLLEFGYEAKDFSLGQLRAWLRKFRIGNPQKWAMYMDANRAKGTINPAFGSRSQSVKRPNQVWEIDSFWNDVVLKYKCQLTETLTVKRYSLIACIDLFTRRALLLLSDTSKAEAICQLLATAIIKWGVPEEVRTDRGKDYLSRRVKRFLENLRVKTSRCLPKHPEQKAFIERFIHTFQHRDLPKLPGFVGHSVTDRQALRNHPDWNEKAIELLMTPEEFQTWVEAWIVAYEQRPHGRAGIGLEGKSPLEVLKAAIAQGWQKQQIRQQRELDFLMMAAPTKDGMRQVGRQGISLNGRLYIASELGDWIGKRVYVCFSPQDPIRIYVYKSADLGEYVCEAVWREAGEINLLLQL